MATENIHPEGEGGGTPSQGATIRRVNVSTPKYPSVFAIVDELDFSLVSGYCWSAFFSKGKMYARARIGKADVLMHRLILAPAAGALIDHRDGNGLNNSRSNIRLATPSQNSTNRQLTKSSSGYRGVRLGARGKWYAQIKANGRSIHLGTFSDPKEGAKKYNEAALAIYGEYAWLNKI